MEKKRTEKKRTEKKRTEKKRTEKKRMEKKMRKGTLRRRRDVTGSRSETATEADGVYFRPRRE
jgi:hypothetical protein